MRVEVEGEAWQILGVENRHADLPLYSAVQVQVGMVAYLQGNAK